MRVVIGAGQIGTAVARVLRRRDTTRIFDEGSVVWDIEPDTMHVAIPWSDDFESIVENYQFLIRPKRVVVHSTVPVGTCDAHGWAHAPIRGRHPNLEEGILASPMIVGGADAKHVAHFFKRCGVNAKSVQFARDTEAGKLWELAQLGMQVRVMREIHDYCEVNGLDFDVVYTRFAQDYNVAYQLLHEPKFVRPVLDYEPGPLGGHCVAQNSPLLGSGFVDEMLSTLMPEKSE